MGKLITLKNRADHAITDASDSLAADRWVAMSNALVRASHGLTLAEKRIAMIAVSKLDSAAPIPPGISPATKITAAEYAELAGCDMPAAYEALQTAAKSLYHRSIVFFLPSHKRGSKRIGTPGTTTTMRWVGRATYHEKQGWVELCWWHELLPHLMALQRNFTSYQLQRANALRSIYSWRLLELLMRFKDTGTAEFTIADFAKSMEATAKQTADFGKIRTKIIEPAVKELIEKDGWLIQWHPIKAGRKVASVRFSFMRDPQGRLPL